MITHPRTSDISARQLHADGLDGGLEGVAVAQSAILDFGAVVIDGVDRVVQELGDSAAVLDAQADEGEDAHVGIQHAGFRQSNAALGTQQGVEVVDKVGEQHSPKSTERKFLSLKSNSLELLDT